MDSLSATYFFITEEMFTDVEPWVLVDILRKMLSESPGRTICLSLKEAPNG